MNYFSSNGKVIKCEAPYIEFYIPSLYFKPEFGFATDIGSIVKALGVFDIGIFENGELKEMRVLNLPIMVDLYVNDFEDRKVQLPRDDSKTDCRVIKYNKGDTIMQARYVEDADNVASYLKFIIKGKVPSIVPYNKTLQIWQKNQKMNGTSLGVPSVIEELILSASYRNKNNPSEKFSTIIGKDPEHVSQYDYIMNNIRSICQYTSTFTAMTFEDLDTMITTSLNRTRSKGTEAYSPVEELLKL